jgi:hypothetical protein
MTPAPSVDGAKMPVNYSLRVIRVLRGKAKAGEVVHLAGDGDTSGLWDTSFSDHGDQDFWVRAAGRMGVRGNCKMVPPQFLKGRQYLVLLGAADDTKQFERVDSPSDKWLTFVLKQVSAETGSPRTP